MTTQPAPLSEELPQHKEKLMRKICWLVTELQRLGMDCHLATNEETLNEVKNKLTQLLMFYGHYWVRRIYDENTSEDD